MTHILPIGTVLRGKSYTYHINRVLGQGSFGITYLATTKIKFGGELGNLETTAQVALKEFFVCNVNGREGSVVTSSSKGGFYEKYKRKFINEASNISHLDHPHIVRVLEAFEANNTAYYAMEFCENGNLDSKINNTNGLSENEALGYFEQIASALHYMHNNKLLHLDLKPGNIMLRDDKNVALIDFGLSKQYDENGNPESSTSVGSGTSGYAPLEQISYKEGRDFPVTMDVYALGATLYKMLTGMCPPEATEILENGLDTNCLVDRGVSQGVIAAIEKAMSPTRKTRYQSISEFASAMGYDLGAAVTPQHEQIVALIDNSEEAGSDVVISTLALESEETPLLTKNPPLTPKEVLDCPVKQPTTQSAEKSAEKPTPKPQPQPAPAVGNDANNSKRKLLLILAVLLVLIVSGVGYYLFSNKSEHVAAEQSEQTEQTEPARQAAIDQAYQDSINQASLAVEKKQEERVEQKQKRREEQVSPATEEAIRIAKGLRKSGDNYNRRDVAVPAVKDGSRRGKEVRRDASVNELPWEGRDAEVFEPYEDVIPDRMRRKR